LRTRPAGAHCPIIAPRPDILAARGRTRHGPPTVHERCDATGLRAAPHHLPNQEPHGASIQIATARCPCLRAQNNKGVEPVRRPMYTALCSAERVQPSKPPCALPLRKGATPPPCSWRPVRVSPALLTQLCLRTLGSTVLGARLPGCAPPGFARHRAARWPTLALVQPLQACPPGNVCYLAAPL
jgi:hypothetical protein